MNERDKILKREQIIKAVNNYKKTPNNKNMMKMAEVAPPELIEEIVDQVWKELMLTGLKNIVELLEKIEKNTSNI